MKIFLPVAFLFVFVIPARTIACAFSIATAADSGRTDSSGDFQKRTSLHSIFDKDNSNLFFSSSYPLQVNNKQVLGQSDYDNHPYLVTGLITAGVVVVILYTIFAMLKPHNS